MGRGLVALAALGAAVAEALRPRAGGALFLAGTAVLLVRPWWVGDVEGGLYLALAWWAAWACKRVAGPGVGLGPFVGALALAALYGAFAYRLGGSLGPLTFPLHWHNQSAALFATAVPGALVLAVAAKGHFRWLWAGAGAMLVLTTALTGSRAGLAVALLPLPLLPWLLGGAERAAKAWKGALAAAAAALGLAALLLGPRLADLLLGGHSAASRLAYAKGALALGAGAPLAGVGWGAFGVRYPAVNESLGFVAADPHSWPLRAWAEGGLPGLILAAAMAVAFAGALRRSRGARPASRAFLLGAAALLLHGLVDFDSSYMPLPLLFGALWAWGDEPTAPAAGGRASRAAALLGAAAALLLAWRLVPPPECGGPGRAACADALLRRAESPLRSRRDLAAGWRTAVAPYTLAPRMADLLYLYPHEAGLREEVGAVGAGSGEAWARPILEEAIALDPLNRPAAALALAADLMTVEPRDEERARAVVGAALAPWPAFVDPEEAFGYVLDARRRRLDCVLGALWRMEAAWRDEGPGREQAEGRADALLDPEAPRGGERPCPGSDL